MIANTFTAVQLLEVFYISLASDLIRSNCPLLLLQEPDFMLNHHSQQPQKKPTDQAAARHSLQPHRAGEA